jgi:predicted flap endonuclease-1-like 5' DNA nuclease
MFSDFLLLHVVECPNCLTKAVILFVAAILLGLLLGWLLWGRFRARMLEAEKERDDYHSRFTTLEKDYSGLKYQHEELTKEAGTFRSRIGGLEADKATLQAQLARLKEQLEGGSMVAGAGAAEADDLKIIEGVGPKIEVLLNNAGIRTFQDVVNASVDTIRGILDAAGSSFKLADPSTWGKQARLAADAKWDELKELQDKLKGGRE